MQHVVIIGNGIAGITAARHIRKLGDDKITVISGESKHFFSRTALMYIYMGHMKYENTKPYEDWFWAKNEIGLIYDWVSRVDFDQKTVALTENTISYDKLIIATGSAPNKFGWPGQDLMGVQGLYSLQDLKKMEDTTRDIKSAVVVGGGLIGVEMAEMLHSRGIHVTYLIREKNFWGNVLPEEESALISNHLLTHGITLKTETELDRILDDGTGQTKGIVTKSGEEIACEFVGLTIGVSPNVSLFKNTTLKINKGILVDDYLQTNIADVYAIGDCAEIQKPQNHRRPIEAVWYVGRMMGETVAHTITKKPTTYVPGIWFNSAKFFDIEYQTYGNVPAKLNDDQRVFYWESEDKSKCLKIVFDSNNLKVRGVNFLGIRTRHEIWDDWIKAEKDLPYVVKNLPKANFDPEFFKRYEPAIQQSFNLQFPEHAVVIRRKGFFEKVFNG